VFLRKIHLSQNSGKWRGSMLIYTWVNRATATHKSESVLNSFAL